MFYQILLVHFFAVTIMIVVVYRQGSDSLMSSSEPPIRRDKALGWIPNPRTPMNFFYNQVCESFFAENASFLAVLKQKFSEEFHKEARRHYTVRQEFENVKSKTQQLDNTKKPFHSWLPTEGDPHIKAQ